MLSSLTLYCVGFNDAQDRGVWTWESGAPVVYRPQFLHLGKGWRSYPPQVAHEDYSVASSDGGGWDIVGDAVDVSENDLSCFICEYVEVSLPACVCPILFGNGYHACKQQQQKSCSLLTILFFAAMCFYTVEGTHRNSKPTFSIGAWASRLTLIQRAAPYLR